MRTNWRAIIRRNWLRPCSIGARVIESECPARESASSLTRLSAPVPLFYTLGPIGTRQPSYPAGISLHVPNAELPCLHHPADWPSCLNSEMLPHYQDQSRALAEITPQPWTAAAI